MSTPSLAPSGATAGNARITNSGDRSYTAFVQEGSGGNATLINANPTSFITVAEVSGLGTTAGSIAGDGTIFLGSKNLTVGGNQQSTIFSGVISDGESPDLPVFLRTRQASYVGGSLTKVGSGRLTLTGANTYSGGTYLNGGILAVNSDDNLGTGPLSFGGGTLEALGAGGGLTSSKPITLAAGGGIFLADAGTASILRGVIMGVGSWTKAGPGSLTLGGANTYTGGTTIAGGTVITQSVSALGSGPIALNGGTRLQVQDLLNVNGNWTVFSGTATVSGGTVQTAGGLNLGGGGTLLANASFNVPGAASINDSGLVVNNQFTVDRGLDLNGHSAVLVNGVLTASAVNVNNLASLIVNPSGNVAANVNVSPGAQLALAGRINGIVSNAGFLQGTGVIAGSLINSGIVAPGASVGKLTINGNYTQNPSGTLRVEVAGSSPGQYDVLVVNGRISLAGRLQFVPVGGFKLRVGDQIAFLVASGGVSGTFGTVENGSVVTGTIVTGEVVYMPNGVVLEGTQGSFAEIVPILERSPEIVLPPNSLAVAEALDSLIGDPRASALIQFLNNLPLSDLPRAFEQISPDELTSINVVGVSSANVQGTNLAQRMGDIRMGSSGFDSTRFSINGSGPSFWEGLAGVNGPEGERGEAVFAPFADSRWGAFVTGIGEFTNVGSTFNAPGYDLATGGFTLGVDYRIGTNFAIGLTGGYAYTGVSLAEGGKIEVNGGKLGVYATAFGSGFYLDGAVTGGFNGYDLRRTGLQGVANGSTVGGDLNVFVAAGYDWKIGGLSIGPTASFQYTLVGFNGFTESGSLAPLAFPDQDSNSLRTTFGMRVSYDLKFGPVRLIPEIRGAWQHEYGETDYSIIASFANGAGDSFTVNGPPIGRDSFLLGAGFAVQWNDRITTYAYYDGEFFRENYLSNNVSAGVRITF